MAVATIYPVLASCRAFEDYTRVTNSLASQNLKIGGFTVPLNYLYNRNLSGTTNSDLNDKSSSTTTSSSSSSSNISINDERALQIHLISIQKWFIYWIVIAIISLLENILFLKYIIPGYSIFRLIFNIWLIIPMISIKQEVDANSTFDNTIEWKKFTSNGAGLLYFSYIKPFIEQHIDCIRKFSINPLNFILIERLKYLFNKNNQISPNERNNNNNNTTTTNGNNNTDYSNVLDSFVMVMNMKNKFTGGTNNTRDINELDNKTNNADNEFDVVNVTPDTDSTQVNKRKGFFW